MFKVDLVDCNRTFGYNISRNTQNTKGVFTMMLGEKIRQLRKGRGLSQEELAGQLTVSRQALSKWELGESVPDTENVVQLSKIFNVSTDYLLNEDYKSDEDIPAVKVSNEALKTEYRSRTRIASYWLTGIGLLGVLTMWILSFAIPANKTVPSEHGGTFLRSIEVRGELGAFLEWFNLSIPFTICCVLAFIGVILMLYSFDVFKKKKR
jgi:transcriptional regulator with XRE-family HTH domain